MHESLSYCRNPVLICVLVIEMMKRGETVSANAELYKVRKKRGVWENVTWEIDKKLVRKYGKNVALLYMDTDITGRSLPQIIRKLGSEPLMMLEGIGTYLEYGWSGPYPFDIHLLSSSSLYRFLANRTEDDQRSKSVFFFSFRNWVMCASFRFYISLAVGVFFTLQCQTEFLVELDRIGEIYQRANGNAALIKIVAPTYTLLFCCVYSLATASYFALLFVHCRLARIPFNFLNPEMWSSIIAAVGAGMYHYNMYSNEDWVEENIHSIINWATVWLFSQWLQIIFRTPYSDLELTQQFGVIVKTLKSMVLKTLGFSVLLGIIIYCYASAYLMRNYKDYVQSKSLTNSLFYFFNAMIGNYDEMELFSSDDSWAIPLMISFVGITTVILMNLLIAMLSHIYETNQMKLQLEYREIQMEYVSVNIVSPRTRLMNVSIPPFSLICLPLAPLMFTRYAFFISKIVLQAAYICSILPILTGIYLIFSIGLVLPVYVMKFAVVGKGVISEKGAEVESSQKIKRRWRVKEVIVWAVVGIPVLLKDVGMDTVGFVRNLIEDVEPDLLQNHSISIIAPSYPPSSIPESTSLFSPSLSNPASSFSDYLSPHISRICECADIDQSLVSRVCSYNPHFVTPWVGEDCMRDRFVRGVEMMEVGKVRMAIRRAGGKTGKSTEVLQAIEELIKKHAELRQ